jgi:hypothetical protein
MSRETAVQVTLPVERKPDGSSSDGEEDEFDKERHHSVLPHTAGTLPFKHQKLSTSEDGESHSPLAPIYKGRQDKSCSC